MEDVSRYLSLAYLVFGLILAWVFSKTFGLLFVTFKPSADVVVAAGIHLSVVIGVVVAGAVTALMWRHERLYTYFTEVGVEMTKTTWPSKDETYRSTYVVIVFAILVAVFLACFDLIWKFATDALLSV